MKGPVTSRCVKNELSLQGGLRAPFFFFQNTLRKHCGLYTYMLSIEGPTAAPVLLTLPNRLIREGSAAPMARLFSVTQIVPWMAWE